MDHLLSREYLILFFGIKSMVDPIFSGEGLSSFCRFLVVDCGRSRSHYETAFSIFTLPNLG